MNKTFIQKFGVEIEVSSSNQKFLSFVEKYFSQEDNKQSDTVPAMTLVFNFKAGFSFKMNGSRLSRQKRILGENIGEDQNGHFEFRSHELGGRFDFSKQTWHGECTFQKNLFKHFSNLLFFKGLKTQEHYYRFLVRLIIQNLLFMRIQEKHEIVVLSAAAVEIDGQAKVFAGLPGSGKTTIVETIKDAIPKARILAENYVLIKEGQTYMFTEGKSVDGDRAYNVSDIFIVSRANEFHISPISPEESSYMLKAINEYTAELPKHSPFVNNLLLSKKFMVLLDDSYLDKILASITSHILIADIGLVKLRDYFKKYE